MDAETVDKDLGPKTSTTEEDADQPADSPSSSVPQIINLNEHKAGLIGLDKEKINKIIQEASKGSAFYNHQQIRQKRINKQIEQHKKKLAQITETQRNLAIAKADATISQLQSTCSLNRIMVHFDMDMFFAAVEIKYNPSLADKPMAVGSLSMISTSNYVARKYGIYEILLLGTDRQSARRPVPAENIMANINSFFVNRYFKVCAQPCPDLWPKSFARN